MAGNLTAMIASIFSGSAVTADPYYEYTTLLLPGSGTNGAQNNTFLDGSTNNFTITRNGNTTQGTFSPFSQTGWGNYFSGSNQIAATPSASELNFSTGDFTVEFWAYVTSNGSEWFYCSSTSNNGLMIGKSDTYTSGGIAYGRKGVSWDYSTAVAPVPNTWEHVAITRSGTSIRVFKNGTQIGTTQTSSVAYDLGLGNAAIGSGGGTGYMVGHISNFRAVKGRAVYTSNFTPPTAPLTRTTGGSNPPQGTECSLLTCQSNRFLDSNGVNTPASSPLTITATGSPTVVAFSPFNPTASWSAATYGGSGYFDGSGDGLTYTTPSTVVREWWVNDFTIEAWVYPISLTGWSYVSSGITLPTLIGNASTTVATNYWSFGPIDTGVARLVYYNGSGNVVVSSTETVKINQWNHIAFTKTSSGVSIFVNGIGTTATALSGTPQSQNTVPLTIGLINATSINGYASNVRIVNGTAVYSGTTYTVPTAPLTAITNTSLLLNFTNAGIYDATSKNDLETVGDAQISNTTAKWGSTSIKFDGTGDWLLNQSPIPPTTFGSGDFSIEMWIYATTSGTQRWLFDGRIATPADGAYPAIYISSGNVLVYYVSAAARITGTTTITTNTWHFVQVIRTSGTTKMYLNGTQEGSNYTDSTVYLNPGVSRPIIGAATNLVQPFTGYIQDLRVTTGYARPTTTPTAAFLTL